jgi:UDP-glucose 4-epimerase
MVEQILDDYHDAYGLNFISLRYFNAAGADPDAEIGEDHHPETHLIPLALQVALGKRAAIQIYGDDYPTQDGTCIRDYIHVHDLAGAHLLALEKILNDGGIEKFNLGNGNGYSVREVIDVVRKVTGKSIPEEIIDRRPGDPPALVGSNKSAVAKLNWQLNFPDLHTIIETAWRWHQHNPNGYMSC